MAARTIQTGPDLDAALSFLGRQSRPPVDGESYFMNKIQEVTNNILKEADESRFSLIKELMDDKNKGQSISKLRDLLGV